MKEERFVVNLPSEDEAVEESVEEILQQGLKELEEEQIETAMEREEKKQSRGKPSAVSNAIESIKEYFLGLPGVQKVLLIAGSVLILASLIGLIALGISKISFPKREEKPTPEPTPTPSQTEEEEEEENESQLVVDQTQTILQKTKDAGQEYIKDTLFIGDSNYARLVMYNLLGLENVIGIEGMGIESVPYDQGVYFVGFNSPVTIPKAVELMQPRRIVMNFGTNNLTIKDTDWFIEKYEAALDAIEKAYPYADIVVQSIPPIRKNPSSEYSSLDYKQVAVYNEALVEMCEKRGIHYLDVNRELLMDTDGSIKSEYIYSDGIHLEKVALEKVLNYVRRHALNTEDRRPEVKDVPTRKAAPVKTYTYNPDKAVAAAMAEFSNAGYTSLYIPVDENNKEKVEGNYMLSRYITYTIPASATTSATETAQGKAAFSTADSQVIHSSGSQVAVSYSANGDGSYTITMRIREYCEHRYTGGVCSICGTKDPNYKTEHTHTWGEWTEDKASTCKEAGSRSRVCSECKEKESEALPLAEHTWGEWANESSSTCKVAGSRSRTCTVCGKKESEALPLADHTWGEWKTDSESTCAVAGSRSRVCTVCGEKQSEALPLAGHTWGNWSTTKEPAVGQEGEQQRVCSVCNTTETAAIPALEPNPEPNPDNSTSQDPSTEGTTTP